jgi:hypothetical protein
VIYQKGDEKLRKSLNNSFFKFKGEKGSVALIAAVSLVVLLGFSALVLDLGMVYTEGSRLQNALDSAVLAAVQELPADNTASTDWSNAVNTAVLYAGDNGYALAAADFTPVYKDNISTNEIIGIRALSSEEVDFNFAKVLGIDSGTVSKKAAAGIYPAGVVTGAIPLCVSANSLSSAIEAGVVTDLTIKCSSNSGDIGIDTTGVSGWFGALRFDGSGASVYTELLSYGYSGMIYVGQILDMENGNMSGPTLDGFTTRYNSCSSGCTVESHDADCPRLVYIPVVDVISGSQVQVVSFAAFFLEECGGNGKNAYIKATYLSDAFPSGAVSETGAEDFGVYMIKLFD